MKNTFNFTIKNNMDELPDNLSKAALFFKEHNLPEKTGFGANLVLEEVCANIIQHGYKPKQTGKIVVSIVIEKDRIFLEIRDNGVKFNPLALPWQNRLLSAQERPEKGLGVNFVRNIMDLMQYSNKDKINILSVWINF